MQLLCISHAISSFLILISPYILVTTLDSLLRYILHNYVHCSYTRDNFTCRLHNLMSVYSGRKVRFMHYRENIHAHTLWTHFGGLMRAYVHNLDYIMRNVVLECICTCNSISVIGYVILLIKVGWLGGFLKTMGVHCSFVDDKNTGALFISLLTSSWKIISCMIDDIWFTVIHLLKWRCIWFFFAKVETFNYCQR